MANPIRKRSEQPLARRPEDMFTALRREMDRVFEDFTRPFDFFPIASPETINEITWTPRMNVEEHDNDILITLEVPGVDEKDIEILTDADSITIRGQKRQEAEDRKANFYRFERSFGSFERAVSLPVEVSPEKAEAKFRNGILQISLPKSEKATENVRKIPIRTESEVRSAQASVPQQQQSQKTEPREQATKEQAKQASQDQPRK